MTWVPQVAVLISCLNEKAAIAKVVADFRAELPDALIFLYDNGSKDRTVEVARGAGAIVRSESLTGKGNVVRRMFADTETELTVHALQLRLPILEVATPYQEQAAHFSRWPANH